MSRNYNPSSSCRRLLSILSPPPPYCCYVVYVYMHHKKIPFSADQKHGNIFPFSRILTSNIYALSLNPQKSKKNLRGLLEKRKKTIKKMCLMKKFTICWCLEEKKVLLKMEFFLPCSRATSSEEQKCLKKSLWKKPTLKKKQDSFVIADSPTTSFYLKKKIEKKKTRKNYNKYTWSHLLKTCLMNTKWWNDISFSRKKKLKKSFHEKNAKKISLLMSKTMRKKKMKRYVQNLPYMHHDENSFRKSQISVTLSLAFQDKSKNFYYSTAIATLLLLYYLNYNYIILLLQYYELLKKSIFQSFCYCFSAPL